MQTPKPTATQTNQKQLQCKHILVPSGDPNENVARTERNHSCTGGGWCWAKCQIFLPVRGPAVTKTHGTEWTERDRTLRNFPGY